MSMRNLYELPAPTANGSRLPTKYQTYIWARGLWSAHTLSTRFLIVSSMMVVFAMGLVGSWLDHRIRQSVIRNATNVSALYMESLISRPVQELATSDRLSAEAKLAISGLIEDTALGLTIIEIKVWRPDGTLVFSTRPTDTRPPPTIELMGALSGQVTAEFNDQEDLELASLRDYGRPIFEVYAPMYEKGTKRIIGVAEIYEDASDLVRDFTITRQQSWIIVGSLTAVMMTVLFATVYRSSQILVLQKAALEKKHQEKADLLRLNADLRSRMVVAHQKSSAAMERQLRRVSADLHDGPAQLMALALLGLRDTSAKDGQKPREGRTNVAAIRSALEQALSDIRIISAGLSLPQIEVLSPETVIRLAVDNHLRLTRGHVSVVLEALPNSLPCSIKTCLFRCVQEGLSNACRHAQGRGQSVTANAEHNSIVLEISDSGVGFELSKLRENSNKLGITGMRYRVESLGGSFNIASRLGEGTQIKIVLPVTEVS